MKDKLYWYKIENIRVIDGDSIEADIDLGAKIWMRKQDIRLAEIDTPECRTRNKLEKEAGLLVKKWIYDRIANPKSKKLLSGSMLIRSIELDKFGRWLAYLCNESLPSSINGILVRRKYAHNYEGGKKQGWTEKELNYIIKELGEENGTN